jgi:deoxyribodipyrimidine photo-lyase
LPDDAAKPLILWFRKDLRLDDNHALHAACASGRPIIPVFIREPSSAGTGPLGGAQDWWLHHSLVSLSNIARSAWRLAEPCERRCAGRAPRPDQEQRRRYRVWNRRYDPAGIAIDTRIKRELEQQGIKAKSFAGQLLHEPSRLKTGGGTPYRVYTPFWRALENSGEPPRPLDAPDAVRFARSLTSGEKLESWGLLPTKPNWAKDFSQVWSCRRRRRARKAFRFLDQSLDGYKINRDFPAKQTTSMLSPYLALGVISPAPHLGRDARP